MFGHPLIRLASCASTNDEALERAAAGAAPGTVVVAREQTRGRGRLGRTWLSPPGENLTASFIMKAPERTELVPPMTLAAGLAVHECVERLGVCARLKWPNDVLCGDRKLAGLLAEMRTQGGAVVGVVTGLGLNVNTTVFPAQLRATSLALELGKTFDVEAVMRALFEPMTRWMARYEEGGVAAIAGAWRERAILGPVTFEALGRTMSGTVVGLATDGGLEVREAGGTLHVLHSGCIALAPND